MYWSNDEMSGVNVAVEAVDDVLGLMRLLASVSLPSKVAKVPAVGSVSEVFPVAVKVCVNAPA